MLFPLVFAVAHHSAELCRAQCPGIGVSLAPTGTIEGISVQILLVIILFELQLIPEATEGSLEIPC